MSTVTVYTRAGCPLCDEAIGHLVHLGADVETVDVDADPALVEAYGERVPVVVAGGTVITEGAVSLDALRRVLADLRPSDGDSAGRATL